MSNTMTLIRFFKGHKITSVFAAYFTFCILLWNVSNLFFQFGPANWTMHFYLPFLTMARPFISLIKEWGLTTPYIFSEIPSMLAFLLVMAFYLVIAFVLDHLINRVKRSKRQSVRHAGRTFQWLVILGFAGLFIKPLGNIALDAMPAPPPQNYVAVFPRGGIPLREVKPYIIDTPQEINVSVSGRNELVERGAPTLNIVPGSGTSADVQAIRLSEQERFNGQSTRSDKYIGTFTISSPGEYIAEAEVDFTDDGTEIKKVKSYSFRVRGRYATILSVNSEYEIDPRGCVIGLIQTVSLDIDREGEFVVNSGLDSQDSRNIRNVVRSEFNPGIREARLAYDIEELHRGIHRDGYIKFMAVNVVSFSIESEREHQIPAPSDMELSENDLCREPMILGQLDRVEPVIVDGYIDQLNFIMPVEVETAGPYQFSHHIEGKERNKEVSLFQTQQLEAGPNEIILEVGATKALTLKQPYQISSAAIINEMEPNGFIQRDLGIVPAYEIWQFTPELPGDLNNDGVVDEQDIFELKKYIETPPLSPGDRRDLNRDGKIDLIDVENLKILLRRQ